MKKIEKFDCAIITVLKEEMELFLKTFKNNIFITTSKANYIIFYFCDKYDHVRKGIIYNIGSKMGNSAACQLMYEFSRKYKADLYINVGVSCGLSDVNIGDVVIVSECCSLAEKNSTNSELQQTQLTNYDNQYIVDMYNDYASTFDKTIKETSQISLAKVLDKIGKSKVENSDLVNLFPDKLNEVVLGECATVPYVVKDKKTFNKIKKKRRKCNVIDMEAYYLAYWHNLIKRTENERIGKNSKFIIIKSPSDNGVENDKEELERIGTRELAMTNLSSIVECIISQVYTFTNEKVDEISEFINKKFSSRSVDKLFSSNLNPDKFNKLCKYLISNEPVDDYFEFAINALNREKTFLSIHGPSGTGKSTYISYIHNILQDENCCVYIDLPKVITHKDSNELEFCLYLIEKLIYSNTEKDVIIILDGIGNNILRPSDAIKKIYRKISNIAINHNNKKVSLCVNDSLEKYLEQDDLPKINIGFNIAFHEFSVNNTQLHNFVEDFIDYYSENTPCSFDSKVIVKILTESNIQYINFRLLKLICDNYNLLKNTNDFNAFIEEYCNLKLSSDKMEYISSEIYDKYYSKQLKSLDVSNIQEQHISTYESFNQNYYTSSYLLAKKIWELFSSATSNIYDFEFVISKNVNMFLIHCIASSDSTINKKVVNILTKIERNHLKKSTEIQFLYILCQEKVYEKLPIETQKAIKQIVNRRANDLLTNEQYNEWDYLEIMNFRTMSIIMNSCFNDDKYLAEYRSRMVNNNKDNEFLIDSILFDCLYYSQECFPYSEIKELSVNAISSAMIIRTIDYIDSIIRKHLHDSFSEFLYMYFVSYLYIYKQFISKRKSLSHYKDKSLKLINDFYNANKSNLSSKDFKEYYDNCIS